VNKNYKDILDYLDLLKRDKERQLETGDFSKVQSVSYGLQIDINSLETVINIVKADVKMNLIRIRLKEEL
jgi:hypothetical protein